MRLKLVLAYDGTAYHGWQIQSRPCPPPTIQGAVETALFKLVGAHVRVIASGRTDTGVHALGQVAHVDIPAARLRMPADWRHSLNALLPDDIRIFAASPCEPSFHARNDALCKTYVYDFWQERAFIPPPLRHYVWPCGALDIKKMTAALPPLLGSHDFASFQNAGTPQKSTVREILDVSLQIRPLEELFPACSQPPLRLVITATGFLKQMVRNIAGYLCHVGQGKIDSARLPHILAARDRRSLPTPTAPPCGLTLAHVTYGRLSSI